MNTNKIMQWKITIASFKIIHCKKYELFMEEIKMVYPTCFICYAWGTEERYQQLEFLRSMIIEMSDSQVEVILDRHSYSDKHSHGRAHRKDYGRIRFQSRHPVFFTVGGL